MKIDVHLRELSTGFERVYCDPLEYEDGLEGEGHVLWQYTDGNYGCDHNRALFLFDWGAAREYNESDFESCHTNLITIDKIVNRDTGEIIAECL